MKKIIKRVKMRARIRNNLRINVSALEFWNFKIFILELYNLKKF